MHFTLIFTQGWFYIFKDFKDHFYLQNIDWHIALPILFKKCGLLFVVRFKEGLFGLTFLAICNLFILNSVTATQSTWHRSSNQY